VGRSSVYWHVRGVAGHDGGGTPGGGALVSSGDLTFEIDTVTD
jgi:hypothetical protein